MPQNREHYIIFAFYAQYVLKRITWSRRMVALFLAADAD